MEYRNFRGYRVGEDGTVIGRRFERPMIPHVNDKGYYWVGLVLGGKYTSIRVNRLVAHLWLGLDLRSDLEVDHMDEDKSNNHWSNLQVLTSEEHVALTVARQRRAMGDTASHKVCRKCRTSLPRSSFYASKQADGLSSYCKPCILKDKRTAR